MNVTVTITRRPEIADPQGSTVARALADLGYDAVRSVRIDRTVTLEVAHDDPDEVRRLVAEMCEKIIANPVLEDYHIEVAP